MGIGMKSAPLIENQKVVPGIASIDAVNSTVAGDVCFLKDYRHATVIFNFGNLETGGTFTCKVEECDNATPTTHPDLVLTHMWKGDAECGAATTPFADQFTATAATTGVLTMAVTDDDKHVVVEIDSDELTDGYPGFRASVTASNHACLVGVTYILSQPRYASCEEQTSVVA